MPCTLAHRVRRALKPRGAVGCLLGGKDLDEAAREHVETIRLRDVPVERRRVELRQNEDALQARVQAVADRHVDEAILAADRDRRLRAHVRQRVEAASAASTQNQGKHVVHAEDVSGIVGDFARPSRIRRRFVTLSRDDRCRSVAGGRSCEGGRPQRADVPRNASGSPSPITGRRPELTPPVRARLESASVIQACVA